MKKNFAIKTYRRKNKTTAEWMITDLLIIDNFSVLNFNCIAVRIGIENTSDEVEIYVYLHF